MRNNKKGRINGTHTQHRVSLMIDNDNWAWYCNLNNKARAINDLIKQEQEKENKLYYEQIILEKSTKKWPEGCNKCYWWNKNTNNCNCKNCENYPK